MTYCFICSPGTWNIRFAKWKREAMEHFRQHTTMFNGLLNTVRSDIVKSIIDIHANTLLSRHHSRLKVLNDQVWAHHS